MLIYIAVSLIGTRLRDVFTSHLTRVRTIRIGLPQHAQFTAGRGWGGGTTTRLISCTSFTSLLLGCRKPKLRARLNPFGRICSKILRRKSTTSGTIRGQQPSDMGTKRLLFKRVTGNKKPANLLN